MGIDQPTNHTHTHTQCKLLRTLWDMLVPCWTAVIYAVSVSPVKFFRWLYLYLFIWPWICATENVDRTKL